jgi:hypothetical protein
MPRPLGSLASCYRAHGHHQRRRRRGDQRDERPNGRTPETALMRFVASFDNFVGAGEDLGRDGDAERAGSLQIDDQLVGRGLLHRQIGRLGALEDLIHLEQFGLARNRGF